MPRRILIDADPGIDDALALALGRAFIGYEIEAETAAGAQTRIESADCLSAQYQQKLVD